MSSKKGSIDKRMKDAISETHDTQANDIIVLASDGVFDNLRDDSVE